MQEKRSRRKKCEIEQRYPCKEAGCSKAYSTHSGLKKHFKEKHLFGRKKFNFKPHLQSHLSRQSYEINTPIISELGFENAEEKDNSCGIDQFFQKIGNEINSNCSNEFRIPIQNIPEHINKILSTNFNTPPGSSMILNSSFETKEIQRLNDLLNEETNKRTQLESVIGRIENEKQELEKKLLAKNDDLQIQINNSIGIIETLKQYILEQENTIQFSSNELIRANSFLSAKDNEIQLLRSDMRKKEVNLIKEQEMNDKLRTELENYKLNLEKEIENFQFEKRSLETQNAVFEEEIKKLVAKNLDQDAEKLKLIDSFKQIQSLISHNVNL